MNGEWNPDPKRRNEFPALAIGVPLTIHVARSATRPLSSVLPPLLRSSVLIPFSPPPSLLESMDSVQKTSIGLDENIAGALAYALGWITGVGLLIVEHENQFVRFHAMQSSIAFGALCALWFIGFSIPILGWVLSIMVVTPVSALVWLLMLYKAYRGERFKLPIAGDIAEQRL